MLQFSFESIDRNVISVFYATLYDTLVVPQYNTVVILKGVSNVLMDLSVFAAHVKKS